MKEIRMAFTRLAGAFTPVLAALLLAACASDSRTPGGYFAAAPARSDATFAQVARGMPEQEVAQLLGRPDETMRFPLSSSEAWDYRYYDTWGYFAVFSVTFGPDGRVASTISNRINSGGDHAGH
jgi:outer membrane protein assembly factor BamE (lipoprotein component of BamABCDE complex)